MSILSLETYYRFSPLLGRDVEKVVVPPAGAPPPGKGADAGKEPGQE
jgi:hypothetical protein